jgi:iron-sulfur cluster assembly protein
MAITLTERAAEEIKRVFGEHELPDGACLRLAIKGGGCSGFSYILDVAGEPAAEDEVFETHGVRIACDPKSYLYLNGTEVDFNDELMKRGFVFNNPNAKNSCGCGASFSA